VLTGPKSREEHFTTGRHVVVDIFCTCCNQLLGWKYVVAFEKSQKYKEGKFILDKGSICKHPHWNTVGAPSGSAAGLGDDDNESSALVAFGSIGIPIHPVSAVDDDDDDDVDDDDDEIVDEEDENEEL
jgi:hypothetical protein